MEPHYCRKCPTKPKAHHWMFKPQGSPDPYNATCKYCGRERRFTHQSPYELSPHDHPKVIDGVLTRGEKL